MSELQSYIDVSYMTMEDFHFVIRELISLCPRITYFEWNEERATYYIEYGFRPLEYDVPPELRATFIMKQIIAAQASSLANRRFGLVENLYDGFPPPPSFPVKNWSSCTINMECWNNYLAFQFWRIDGDFIPYRNMWKMVKNHFDLIKETRENLKTAMIESGVDVSKISFRHYLMLMRM